jgi:hypothetical protein
MYIAKKLPTYAFFSQSNFDNNKQLLNEYTLEIIKINRSYPLIGTFFYGTYYLTQDDRIVFTTFLSYDPEGKDYRYTDKVCLGEIKKFSHYPEEILKKEEYSDEITQFYLYR